MTSGCKRWLDLGKFLIFEVDPMGIAAMRVVLGLAIVWDCVLRLTTARVFLGDPGLLPLSTRLSGCGFTERLWVAAGPFGWCGAAWYEIMLVALLASAAACMILGRHLKLAGALTWWLVGSLQDRNPMVLDGGDQALRIALFWMLFLPSGIFRTGKAAHNTDEQPAMTRLNWPEVAFTLQVLSIYLFAAVLKYGDDWRVTCNAVSYSLSLESLRTNTGAWVLQSFDPRALQWACWLIVRIEELLPFAFLLGKDWRIRMCCAFAGIGLHLCIAALFHIRWFQLIMIALWLPLLPGIFWDTLAKSRKKKHSCQRQEGEAMLPGVLALPFIAYSLLLNVSGTVTQRPKSSPPDWWCVPARFLHLSQNWNLFSPNVRTTDGAVVATFKCNNGRLAFADLGPPPLQLRFSEEPSIGYVSKHWYAFSQGLINKARSEVTERTARRMALEIRNNYPSLSPSLLRLDFLCYDRRESLPRIKKIELFSWSDASQ